MNRSLRAAHSAPKPAASISRVRSDFRLNLRVGLAGDALFNAFSDRRLDIIYSGLASFHVLNAFAPGGLLANCTLVLLLVELCAQAVAMLGIRDFFAWAGVVRSLRLPRLIESQLGWQLPAPFLFLEGKLSALVLCHGRVFTAEILRH
jgi:hypothetical protein